MISQRWISTIALLFFLCSVPSVLSAREFTKIGSRGYAMGGGVSLIDDENAGQWNPANLSLPSSTKYEQDYATSLGIQAGAQVQSTKNFYNNSTDLVDFFDQNQNSTIFQGEYNESNRSQFIELLAHVRDLERDDQGALINGTAGFNSRHTNWSLSVNNITDIAVYTQFDLTGGLALNNTQVQNAFGDTSGVSPTTSEYQDVASTCESTFQSGSWTTGDFSLSSSKTDMANYIANYAEENNISSSQTKKFCKSGNQIIEQSVGGSGNADFDTEAQRIAFEGSSINEASLSYARPGPIMTFGSSNVYFGGTLRFMQGQVVYIEDNPFNSSAADSSSEIFNKNDDVEKSTDVGVDLGLTFDMRDALGLKIGVVGKYLNSPEFKYPDNQARKDTPITRPKKLTIDPQIRVGVSAYPLDYMPVNMGSDWWQISADYDVTKNETLLQNYKKQYLAVGNEFNLINSFWINLSLRAGAQKNLVESAEGTLYSAGVGLQAAGLNVEISGVTSSKTTKDQDGNEQPTLAGGSFNLAYRF